MKKTSIIIEAKKFLKIKGAELAANNFSKYNTAKSFINKLYKLGAISVEVDCLDKDLDLADLPEEIYADALIITFPKQLSKRLDLAVAILSQRPDEVSKPNGSKFDWHKDNKALIWWD